MNWDYIYIDDFSLFSDKSLWAIGYIEEEDGKGCVILHWKDDRWNIVYRTKDYEFSSIKMISPDLGWVIGNRLKVPRSTGIAKTAILMWNGKSWQETSQPNYSFLHTICAFDKEHAWIFGQSEDFTYISLKYSEVFAISSTPTENKISPPSITSTIRLTPTKANQIPTQSPTLPPTDGVISYPSLGVWIGTIIVVLALIIVSWKIQKRGQS